MRRTVLSILYGMNTKLTLRMDESLVRRGKSEAKRRGKSVSQMVGEFMDALGMTKSGKDTLPPVTSSLIGLLKGRRVTEKDYTKHLREKHG